MRECINQKKIDKKERATPIRTLHLSPARIIIRFPRLRKSLDDPPPILKRDPRRIRVPQIHQPPHHLRLRRPRRHLPLMIRRHLPHVLFSIAARTTAAAAAAPRRHFVARAHVRGEKRQVLEEHTLFARADPKGQRRRTSGNIVRVRRCCWHWRVVTMAREFLRTHEHLCKITCCPLGIAIGGGAEDDVGSRRRRFFLELLPLREIRLARQTRLSFPCGLYVQYCGGVEGGDAR